MYSRMVNLQLRIRTPTAFASLEYIATYLKSCVMGFAFEHDKPDNHHYHIYLFGINITPDGVRKTLSRYLPSKEHYSVATTAGGSKKIPLDPRIAYQYGACPKSNPTLIWHTGIEPETLERWAFGAEAFYAQLEQKQKDKNQVLMEVLVINNEKIKVDRTWERLCNELIETPMKYDGYTVPQIKSSIAVAYLRQLKAVPRPSDLHRYAISLYYIAKHGLHNSERLDSLGEMALLEEYA